MAATPINKSKDICRYLSSEMKLRVKIEFGPHDTYQFTTRLIGYKAHQYLALDYPRSVHEALLVRTLSNSTVVLRGMCDTELGHIVAFETSILQSTLQPFPMLFVRMPHHFVTKPIRQHKRIKLSLPATINHQDGYRKIDGTLVDFSVSGCGVLVSGDDAVTSDNFLQKDLSVSIHSPLTTVLGAHIDTRVANMVKQPNGHFVGLRFFPPLTINEELKDVLFEHTVLDNLTH
ncbi:flagellar brake domain-containing protein [Vibrio sp. RC27]